MKYKTNKPNNFAFGFKYNKSILTDVKEMQIFLVNFIKGTYTKKVVDSIFSNLDTKNLIVVKEYYTNEGNSFISYLFKNNLLTDEMPYFKDIQQKLDTLISIADDILNKRATIVAELHKKVTKNDDEIER